MRTKHNFLSLALLAILLACSSCATSYQDRADALNVPEEDPAGNETVEQSDDLVSRDEMLLSGSCIINADCASTQFCELGRCTSECSHEKQCPGDLYCSTRGKCTSSKGYVDVDSVIKTTPPVDWYVDEHVVSLGPDENSASFNIKVGAGGALQYRIQVEPADARDAVGVSVPEGMIGAGGSGHINVAVNRGSFGNGDHRVSVNVISDAGQQNVIYEFSNGLTGRYAGFVEYSDPGLGRVPLVIDMKVDDEGNVIGRTVKGGSLLFPEERTITGQFFKEDNELYFSTMDRIEPDLERDPFGRAIGREINFMGATSKHGVIEGEIEEIVSGLLPNAINVDGFYYLMRTHTDVSDITMYDPGLMPDFDGAGDPTSYATCSGVSATCDAANIPYNMIYCSDEIRQQAFKLGEDFAGTTLAGEDYVNFGIVDECMADMAGNGTHSCVDLDVLKCLRGNQQYYLKNSIASDNEYGAYFKDLNGMQRLYAFIGNDKMVDAYRTAIESISSPLTLELARLNDALASYEQAERIFFGVNNISIVTAASSDIVAQDDYEVFRVPLQYIRASHAALRRSVSLSVRKSMGSAALKDDLRRRVQNYARIMYIQGVALASLVTSHGGSFAYELAQVADELRAISITAGNLEADLNPLGFSADYVPFLGSSDGQGSISNFHRLMEMAETSVNSAVDYAVAAENQTEDLEVRTEDIQQRITNIEQSYELYMVQLCGSAEVELLGECGVNGGEVADAYNQIEQQYIEIESKYQAIMDLNEMVNIKDDMTRQIAGIKGRTLRFMSSNGAVLESLDIAEGEIRAAMLRKSGMFGSIGGFVSGAASIIGGVAQGAGKSGFEPAQMGVGAIAGGASSMINAGLGAASAANSASMAQKMARVQAQKRHLQNQQQLRLHEEGMEIAAVQAAAEVKILLIEMAQMNLNLESAHLRLDQQVIRLTTLLARVDYLMHQREVLMAQASESVSNPFSNLSFRLKRDHAVLMASNKFEEALEDVYLAARGLEYELNVELPQIESQLFQANSAQQLHDFRDCLEGWYYDYAIAYGSSHQEVTQLSLREDILGFSEPVTDEVSGEVIMPQEIFRRILLNPKHISQSGAVEFPFVTSIAGGNKHFSSRVCNDRIESVRVMLVGDFLGDNEAKVQLMQEGDSYLRDCSVDPAIGEDILNTYHLDKKRATIPAGVNSFGLSTSNTALEGISVASDRWVLIIPTDDEEPVNSDIDLLNIDDIVIEITHEARTLNGNTSASVFGQCSI